MTAPMLAAAGAATARSLRTIAIAATLVAVAVSGCGSSDTDTSGDLVGTWTPDDVPSVELGPTFDPSTARITFAEDGTWSASDACNDLSGTYSLDGDGTFDAQSRGSAGVGCGGGQVPYELLLAETAHVEISDDGDATFESSDGTTLLSLDSV